MGWLAATSPRTVVEPRVWDLASVAVTGAVAGTVRPDGITLQPLAGASLIQLRLPVALDDVEPWPVFHYHLDGLSATQTLSFQWTPPGRPAHGARLAWPGDREASIDLAVTGLWQGSVAEIGMTIMPAGTTPLSLRGLRLAPRQWGEILPLWLTEYLAIDGWRMSSINFHNAAKRLRNHSLPLLVAGWVGLASLFFSLCWRWWGVNSFRWSLLWPGWLAGWLLLDGGWSRGLWHQAGDLPAAGTTLCVHAPTVCDFGQAMTRLLPLATTGRVLIIDPDFANDPARALLLHFEWLPRNLASEFSGCLAPGQIHSGDAIVLLNRPASRFHLTAFQEYFRLECQGETLARVVIPYQDAVGMLLRVISDPPYPKKTPPPGRGTINP